MDFFRYITYGLRRLFLALAAISLPFTAYAGGLIRDAEIETTLAAYSHPIFQAAGIPPDTVRVFIVSSPELNAFVAGGLNLFLNTGLILQTKKPGMLIGVIAHETGHIAGAHLSQFQEKSTRAMIGSVVGAALGAAMMIGGGGQAGAGVIVGSQQMAGRNFMGELRLNEASADQAALTFLDANDISATGMLEMFQTLHRYENGASIDPFLSNHPLTTERIAAMRDHINESTIPADQVPEQFYAMHARMVAKLAAFTGTYANTMNLYPATDTSVAGRYAHAIAEFKRSNLPAALKGMDSLIHDYPNDPFFYDTRGQIYFENGKLKEASASYARAAQLEPNNALILTEYAKTLIAQNDDKELPRAILLLDQSKAIDDSYDVTWRQLAIAYGRQGKIGLSYEALAEEAALNGDYKTVLQHVARARADNKNDPALAFALDDLERDAKAQWEKKKKEGSLF